MSRTNFRRDDWDEIAHRLRNAPPALETWCVFCDVPHKMSDAEPGAPRDISHGCCEQAAKQWLKDARLPVEDK